MIKPITTEVIIAFAWLKRVGPPGRNSKVAPTNIIPPITNIRTANGGTNFIKTKSITLSTKTKKSHSWQGFPSSPQGTNPAACEIKGIKTKPANKIIKTIFLNISN